MTNTMPVSRLNTKTKKKEGNREVSLFLFQAICTKVFQGIGTYVQVILKWLRGKTYIYVEIQIYVKT